MSSGQRIELSTLAYRIHRFLMRLESASREPTAYEGHHLTAAIDHLAAGDWPQGEAALLRAERQDLATARELAGVQAPKEPITLRSLYDLLEATGL